jgi:hypothetical protein
MHQSCRILRLLISIVCVMLASPSCSDGESPPPPPPQESASAPKAAPPSTDSPDKLFAELGAAYADAAKVLKGFYDGGGKDAQAWATAFSLECRRLSLIARANAMLAAHPDWKDTSRQWFDRTVKPSYARFSDQAKRFNSVMMSKSKSEQGEIDAGDRFAKLLHEASRLLAVSDPAAQARMDLLRSDDSDARRQDVTKSEETWSTFKERLGLPASEYRIR